MILSRSMKDLFLQMHIPGTEKSFNIRESNIVADKALRADIYEQRSLCKGKDFYRKRMH